MIFPILDNDFLIPFFIIVPPMAYIIYSQQLIIIAQKTQLAKTSFLKKQCLFHEDMTVYFFNLYKSALKSNHYLENHKGALSAIQDHKIKILEAQITGLKYKAGFVRGIPLDEAEQKVQLLCQAHSFNIHKLRILQQQLELGHLQCNSFSPEQLYSLVAPVIC